MKNLKIKKGKKNCENEIKFKNLKNYEKKKKVKIKFKKKREEI